MNEKQTKYLLALKLKDYNEIFEFENIEDRKNCINDIKKIGLTNYSVSEITV